MEDMRKEFFDRAAGSWDAERGADDSSLERVVSETDIRPGQTVLDVGSGTGVLIPFLLKVMGETGAIYALDYAEGMVWQIRKKRFPANVIPVHADIHATPFCDGFFDRVIANACFPHFADREKAFREIRRILRPGGLLVVSIPRGREWVNRHHRQAGGHVKDDRVPPATVIEQQIACLGFRRRRTIDEESFYLVSVCR